MTGPGGSQQRVVSCLNCGAETPPARRHCWLCRTPLPDPRTVGTSGVPAPRPAHVRPMASGWRIMAIATGIAWAVLLFGLFLTAPAFGVALGCVVVPVGAGLISACRPDALLSEARRSVVAVGIALLTLPLVGIVSVIVLFLIVCGPQLWG